MYSECVDILHNSDSGEGDVQKLGPYEIESLVPRVQEGQFTAYRVKIAPGEKTSESYHKLAEEAYYILGGSGTAVLDGKEYELKKGDFLRLPPGTLHGFTASGEGLEMLDLHSPGSRPDRDVYFKGETPDGFTAE